MTQITRQNKCFISAPTGADLDVLISLLAEHGYSVHAPDSYAPGERWIDALRRNLAEADLVVGVLQPNLPAANVTFELGLATGLDKRVVVIAPAEISELPQAFSAFLVVRASLTNREAIGFALDQIAAAPKRRAPQGQPLIKPAIILGSEINQYIRLMDSAQTESQIIETLRQLLIAAGADIVVSEPKLGEGARPDLAIWSDVLGPYVGNPLLVEVKKRIRGTREFQETLNRIQRYMNLAGSMWSILLYIEGPNAEEVKSNTRTSPNIIAMPMQTFMERLRAESLFDVVRTLRNKRVHGVSG